MRIYEETVGEFNPNNTPNTNKLSGLYRHHHSKSGEPTLNSEEIPITSTMRSTLRYVNRSSAGDVCNQTNPHSVVVTYM